MKRLFPFCAILVVVFLMMRSKDGLPFKKISKLQGRTPATVHHVQAVPKAQDLPAVTPAAKIPRPTPYVSVGSADVVKDSERVIIQGDEKWNYVEGVSAIPSQTPGSDSLPRVGVMPGLLIVNSSDVPANAKTYPLAEREDSGIFGVVTGVLKAIGNEGLVSKEQFQSECPCHVKTEYPSIKSYLLEAVDGEVSDELVTCLRSLGVFKKLEWEILASPRVSR